MMGSNTQNRKNALGSRSDIGWKHGREVDNNPKKIECIYCKKIISGNIYRFKNHLACNKKDVKECKSVPLKVKEEMIRQLTKRKIINDEEEEMAESVPCKRGKSVTKSFSNGTIDITPSTLNQNFEKGLRDEACQQNGIFLPTSGIPFSCAKNLEFPKMVGKCGSEFVPASYHELENSSAENEIKITTDMLEWKKTGCSIICDEWTDKKGSSYCKFLVNFAGCTIFLKSIDTYDFSETTVKVFKVLDKIVEEIGEENVVQVITNNTANYKAAAEMLIEKRKGIFWSPCVVRLLDEILEDFEKKLSYHHVTIAKGKKISTFIHLRTNIMSMLKDSANLKDLMGPTIAPSATAYLNLLYLIYMKDSLKKMFSLELKLAETKEGKEIQQIIKDDEFWNDISVCLKFALPIIKVLLKIDSDEKPTMGFIYEEVLRAQESLQSLNDAKGYATISEIIKERLDPLLHPPYTASYSLNPQLRYGSTFKFSDESIKQLCAYLATMSLAYNDNSKVTEENQLQIENQFADFSARKGLFGSQAAIRERDAKDPVEWWDSYGNDCPELKRIVIRLLSLTCSSLVYPKKRDYWYRTKLNDLSLVIQSFKSKTDELNLLNNFPEMPSSGYDLRTENEVGEVSRAKEDMRLNIYMDGTEGVLLSGNEVDTCLYNPQCQSAAPGVPLPGNEVDTCLYNPQRQSAAPHTFVQSKRPRVPLPGNEVDTSLCNHQRQSATPGVSLLGNKVDTCLYNPQRQSAAPGVSLPGNEVDTCLYNPQRQSAAPGVSFPRNKVDTCLHNPQPQSAALGVPLPGNEVDACLYNPQRQSAAPGVPLPRNEVDTCLYNPQRQNAAPTFVQFKRPRISLPGKEVDTCLYNPQRQSATPGVFLPGNKVDTCLYNPQRQSAAPGVPLPGNEVDACLYNPQRQSAAPGVSLPGNEIDTCLYNPQLQNAASGLIFSENYSGYEVDRYLHNTQSQSVASAHSYLNPWPHD